jgi:hypothetical protein
MSVLRSLESKLEGLVQGAFSRAFKARVQPVEIARKLAKEMDEHRAVSISRVYVPNAYTVYLSPGDREPMASYEQGLQRELSDYLLEHARDEGLALLTRPTVEFKTDDRLRLGEFGIQAQLVEPPGARAEAQAPPPPSFGHTMVYSPDREARPLEAPPRPSGGRSLLVGGGKRRVLTPPRVVVGRSQDCDVVLDDPNVSRRHAELRAEEGRWIVADLGSTNGVRVNGRAVERAALEPGDEVTFGAYVLSFERE